MHLCCGLFRSRGISIKGVDVVLFAVAVQSDGDDQTFPHNYSADVVEGPPPSLRACFSSFDHYYPPPPPKWAAGAYTTTFSECISIEKGRDRTQNYTDEVLVTKVANIMYVPSSALRPPSGRPSHTLLTSLVVRAHRNGVIQRSKEKPDENAKLQISYEAFVESLDDEDAFTTKLVEILLKVGFALPWSLFSSLLKTRWLF